MQNEDHPPAIPVLNYVSKPTRIRGAALGVRIVAGAAALFFGGFAMTWLIEERGHFLADQMLPATIVALAGTVFLGCTAAGLVGTRNAPDP